MLLSLKKIIGDSFLASGGLFYTLTTFAISVSAFLFHVMVSRIVGPAEYGLVGSMLGIIALIIVPISAFQLSVTHSVSAIGNRRININSILGKTFLVSSSISVICISLTSIIDHFLKSYSVLPFAVILLWIPFAATSAVVQGALSAQFKFVKLASALFIGNGIIRLLIGLLLVEKGSGALGVMLASLFGQIAVFLCLFYLYRRGNKSVESAVDPKISIHQFLLTMSALIGGTLLISLDTLLSRHFLSLKLSGIYSSAATAAHIVFFIPTSFFIIIYSYLAKEGPLSYRGILIFRQFIAITIVTSIAIGTVFSIFSKKIMAILFGGDYVSGSKLIFLLSLESLFVGLIVIMMVFHIARNSKYALVPWMGVSLTCLTVIGLPKSQHNIALAILVSSFMTLLIIIAPIFTLIVRKTPKDFRSIPKSIFDEMGR